MATYTLLHVFLHGKAKKSPHLPHRADRNSLPSPSVLQQKEANDAL
jgi:hypothetical protein